MKRFKNNISVLFFTLAVSGVMLSMVHYHSDGLECLTHVNEQHVTENELLCPVSGITAVTDGTTQPVVNGLHVFPETIVDIRPLYLSAQPFTPLLGRAPPFLA